MNRQPVPGGYVYAYNAGKHNILGPADAMSEPSGEDGRYLLIVPEGFYMVAARRRVSGAISGPLRNGDLAGQVAEPVEAVSGGVKNLGIILTGFHQGAEGDPKRILTTDTRIEGQVVDLSGRPVPGAHVFAYEGKFRPDPPDFMAPEADEDGYFRISLPGGGTFTVGARTGLRGKPGPEDRIGFWGGRDQPREVEGGSVTEGVRIEISPYGDRETR
ncbi:MAG: carboxypeptidase-like regulatory domain-containing protein [bacterium]|nr:carboxypeptidase-like regulatory domain-containing protein [bacterium]